MSDFSNLGNALRSARQQQEQQADAVAAAREKARHLAEQAEALRRTLHPQDANGAAALAALEAQLGQANAALDAGRSTLKASAQVAASALLAFEALSDPRDAVPKMSDDTPFLLLPLRLETRFLPREGGGTDLCVRVYPDDCLVDTFEASLTEGEVRAARDYWTSVWAANGARGGERAAWRALAASHGSGRAAWIMEHYRPLNDADRPAADATRVLLVIPAQTPAPSENEAAAMAAFWTAVWRADGDPAKEQAAFSTLAGSPGVGDAGAAAERWRPAGLDQPPPEGKTRDTSLVTVAWILFPPPDGTERRQSWTRAPRVAAFPDRLVLTAYPDTGEPLVQLGRSIPLPLVVGPDPYAAPGERMDPKDGGLALPDDMRWMTDFARAVQVGMGFRVPLSAAHAAAGFKRLLVMGVRASDTPASGREALETLLAHHRDGRSGLALVPQGTPTNNTERGPSGFSRTDDPDASFDLLFGPDPAPPPLPDAPPPPDLTDLPPWMMRSDGEWLAGLLGVDPALLDRVPNARGTDQAEARAMNTALWPGTLGYWMDAMLPEVFDDTTVAHARRFFTRYVSGRGAVPALRIGRQPYGIVTATAYSRMVWPGLESTLAVSPAAPFATFPPRLHRLLKAADGHWEEMAKKVGYAGKEGHALQELLDVVTLHPTSAEYALRWAESLEEVYHLLWMQGKMNPEFLGSEIVEAMQLLAKLGYHGEATLLYRFFFSKVVPLDGPLVDDVPASETRPIRAYTPDKRDYLRWLVDAARTSFDTLAKEQGFTKNQPPRALLYLLLRFALETGFHHTARGVYVERDAFSDDDALEVRIEQPFIHVAAEAPRFESRYSLLYDTALLGGSTTVAQHIADRLGDPLQLQPLPGHVREQWQALRRLVDVPTARLERLLAEHVDCCAYRYDAWMLGLVHERLARMRRLREEDQGQPVRGVYLGAYGWLHDVRPQARVFTPVPPLAGDLDAEFRPGDTPPLLRDSANQGYVHAPSLNHAVTAAVLRNGYLTYGDPALRRAMAVNLTSERVRTALGLLEGMREGQSLGALLGYRFERGLHDRGGTVEVDEYIRDIRQLFPLAANRMESTKEAGAAVETVEASNVVDGLALAQHILSLPEAARVYPWGKPLPATDNAGQQKALTAEGLRLLDAQDAVADLALAEGVHQAVQGNYDRVAATTEAFGRGAFPPEPEVVRTPASGTGLTHRVAVHLDPAAASPVSVDAGPRAATEPSLNAWLATVLPPLARVGCVAWYRDPADGTRKPATVTLAQLGVQPVDVLYLLRGEGPQGAAELDDRIVRSVLESPLKPRPGEPVEIEYMARGAADISVFELMPLVRALRRVALASRTLRPSDQALAGEAAPGHDEAVWLDAARVTAARDALAKTRDDAGLKALLDSITGPLGDLPARRGELLAAVDTLVTQAQARLERTARFGVAQAGWGFVHRFLREQTRAVLARIGELVDRWDGRIGEAAPLLAEGADAALPDALRFESLLRAERLVSTTLTVTLPATPEDLAASVIARRGQMQSRRDDFAELIATPPASLKGLMDAATLLDTTAFDPAEWTLAAEEEGIITFAGEVAGTLQAAIAEVDRRLLAAKAALDRHAAASAPAARVQALQDAAKAIFGDDFVLVPRFRPTATAGAELAKAFADTDVIQAWLRTRPKDPVDFPVDDWLYGVARVRDKMRAWEEVVMLSGGFSSTGAEPELTPAQLPWRKDDSWLALEFPEGYGLDRDRLLYTAHAALPYDPDKEQCGLLLDEWTEVIPAADATTGVAFHYDRPNSEPPQAMLLVVPPDTRTGWRWDDLVDAVHETMALARKRAVEPSHIDQTPYARFLPATLTAVTPRPVTIMSNLSRNIGAVTLQQAGD